MPSPSVESVRALLDDPETRLPAVNTQFGVDGSRRIAYWMGSTFADAFFGGLAGDPPGGAFTFCGIGRPRSLLFLSP
jgi:hypothetical protein